MMPLRKYAVVDVETTGRSAYQHKVIEIGIVLIDGDEVVDTFSTLIDPECSVPTFISELTSITPSMLIGAPKFYEVAKKIVELTEGRIFVAHNAHFDYAFLRKEFLELGYSFQREKLCTLRGARLAFPGLDSYSLKSLTHHFNIPLKNAHRALADAKACAEILFEIKKRNLEGETEKNILPPGLTLDQYECLPSTVGIYKLYDHLGTLLYIGKSNDIKRRVGEHFRVNFQKKRELEFKNAIAKIDYEVTHSELLALLLESHLVKELRPIYNRQLRNSRERYGIYHKINLHGVLELQLIKIHSNEEPLLKVKSKRSGEVLLDLLKAQMEKMPSGLSLDLVLKTLLAGYKYPRSNFDLHDGSVVFRVRENEIKIAEIFDETIKKQIKCFQFKESWDSRQIILAFMRKKKTEVVFLEV